MKKSKDVFTNPDRDKDDALPPGNESHLTNVGMTEKRAERVKGAGAHGDAQAGEEGIDEPGGPLPNQFPDEDRKGQ